MTSMTLPPPDHAAMVRTNIELGLMFLIAAVPMVVGLVGAHAPLRRYLTAPFCSLAVMFLASGLWSFAADLLWMPLAVLGNVLCVGSAGYAVGRWMPSVLDVRHYRGAVVERVSIASRHAERYRGMGGVTLADIPVPAGDETKHFKILGTTGTGKTTAIEELLGAALERGDRAVIADPDGGYLGKVYSESRGDMILNPFDPRSRRWDLFAEIREPYDFDQMARSLIPEGEGENRIWQQYARTFLTALMRQAYHAGVRDTTELYRLVTSAPKSDLVDLVDGTAAQPFLQEGNDRMFGSIRSTASTAVAALEYVQRQTSENFSIRQWIREGKGVLFLPYGADQIAALRSMISTWMRIAIFETLTLGPGDARLWFVVDELDALGVIEGLKDALPRVRKFGGRCVLGFQSIAQVSGTYGRSDAETIVENCGNTLILRCSASEGGGTAQFASKLIGDREIVRRQVATSNTPGHFWASHTTSHHHVIESAVLPSEIEQLPDRHGFLKFASVDSWARVQIGG